MPIKSLSTPESETDENSNKFLYNGKEVQDYTGFYDYGFRQYDSEIGRWHVQDALVEKYLNHSPYAYVMNNPVNMYDVISLSAESQTTQELVDDAWYSTLDNQAWHYAYSDGVLTYQTELEYYRGTYIGGDDAFKFEIKLAIRMIDATWLGRNMFDTFVADKFFPHILPWEARPEHHKHREGSYYDSNSTTVYIRLEELKVKMPKGYLPPSPLFLRLGHELWHAYTHHYTGLLWSAWTLADKERAAIGFENYLAHVYRINHVRTGYVNNGDNNIWEKGTKGIAFNYMREYVAYNYFSWNISNLGGNEYYGNTLSKMPAYYKYNTFYTLPGQFFLIIRN